jgi:hypothetical protein
VTNKTRARLWLIAGALILVSCSGEGGYTGGSANRSYYAVTGSIGNLIGSGLVLENNGTSSQAIAANAGSYSFPASNSATGYSIGAPYAITVATQPSNPSQTCTVSDGVGTIAGDTTVNIICVTNPALLVTVTGLAGSGLELLNNGKDPLSIAPVAIGTASGQFSSPIANGAAYDVTIGSLPTIPSQDCAVESPTGTAIGNATTVNISVVCVTNSYAVSGTVSGLTGSGLTVQLNNGPAIPASSAPLSLGNLPSGTSYTIAVVAQPTSPTQKCTPVPASGVIGGAPVSISINCTAQQFAVNATVTGLAGTGLTVQFDQGAPIPILPNTPTPVLLGSQASGASYSVAVVGQPQNLYQTCAATPSSGLVGNGPATVAISCTTNTYSVGGSISGFTGAGLQLQDSVSGNTASPATPTTTGPTTFSIPGISSGANYSVVVKVQPSFPTENCVVINGTGTGSIAGVSVNPVSVVCAPVGTTAFTFYNNGTDANQTIADYLIASSAANSVSITLENSSYATAANASSLAVANSVYFEGGMGSFTIGPCPFALYSGATPNTAGVISCAGQTAPITGSVFNLYVDTSTQATGGAVGGFVYLGYSDSTTGNSAVATYSIGEEGTMSSVGNPCVLGSGGITGTISVDESASVLYVTGNDGSGSGSEYIWACTIGSNRGLAAPATNVTNPTPIPNSSAALGYYRTPTVITPNGGFLYWTGTSPSGDAGTFGFATSSTGALNSVGNAADLGSSGCFFAGAPCFPTAFPTAIDPTGRYLYAVRSVLSTAGFIESFKITQPGGVLAPTSTPTTGSVLTAFPVASAIDPSGTFYYILMQPVGGGNCSIIAYTIDSGTGNLTLSQTRSVGTASELVMDPSGNLIYLNDPAQGQIFVFAINPNLGQSGFGPLGYVSNNGIPFPTTTGASNLVIAN